MAQRYPIGIETFETIREENRLYIDKTEYIHRLVDRGKFYFLSRPHRFGKSLLLSTIKAYFEGKRHLFEGLAIAKYPHDWEPCPVFHFNFVNFNTEGTDGIKSTINQHLRYWEKEYGITENDFDFRQRFYAVIRRAVELTGKKAVVLVDEYDKALISTLTEDKKELNSKFRAILKPLFGTLKAADQYIQFGLLTGVSRFSKLSIFSDINNLRDISLSNEYAVICGITESEMRSCCQPGIRRAAERMGISYEETLAELKKKYDGYHFAKDCPDIYNPFSLFNALEECELKSFWYASGTPTFLLEAIRDNDTVLPELLHTEAFDTELADVDSYTQSPVAMLFQSGYLTIKGFDNTLSSYILGLPNSEVTEGFFKELLPVYMNNGENNSMSFIRSIIRDVMSGNPEKFLNQLKVFLSGIPYYLSKNKPEIYFENNIFIILKLLGFAVHTEYHTSNGRIDLLVTTDKYIYIIELKLNGTAEEAIRQIDSKHYPLQFSTDYRTLFKIGISFSKETRNIDNWIIN